MAMPTGFNDACSAPSPVPEVLRLRMKKHFCKDPIRNSSSCSLWTLSWVYPLLSMLTDWPLNSHLTWNAPPLLGDSSAGSAWMSETLAPSQPGVKVKLDKSAREHSSGLPNLPKWTTSIMTETFFWGSESMSLFIDDNLLRTLLCQLGSTGGEMVIKLPTSAVPLLYKQDPILHVGTDATKVVSFVRAGGTGRWKYKGQISSH